MSKYLNKKTIIDGIKFDSKKEANRYSELKMLETSGYISNLELQKKYILIPKQKIEDVKERECSYTADFVYFDNRTNNTIVEDVKPINKNKKPMLTKDFIIKRKLMLYMHGIKIHIV